MGDPEPQTNGADNGANEIVFEAFGVCLAVSTSEPALLDRIRGFLPPGWQPCPASAVESRFSLTAEDTGTFSLTRDGEPLSGGGVLELDLALEMLDSQLRIYLGRKAPDAIFVHAGVVAHHGRAMVMPSPTFGGKTTLVAALVRSGAVYYSDEFAVIDRDGLVHPYAKPLSVRNGGWKQTDHPIDSFNGVAGDEALPLGMIVVTTFRAGGEWKPKRLSAGAGAMALLANAVPARERSREVMGVISRAARDSVVLESDRGEAEPIAPLLLAELEHQAD